ncbi:MAG: hypothetical protein SWQ30_14380 [Thermodesulfobacteriota bacterium]|nr:hypothetical protein [Thermodesulfobacteriota bacterium]
MSRARPDRFDLVIAHRAGVRSAKKRINEQRAMAMGMRAFVMKPIIRRERAETVRKVLDGKKG